MRPGLDQDLQDCTVLASLLYPVLLNASLALQEKKTDPASSLSSLHGRSSMWHEDRF